MPLGCPTRADVARHEGPPSLRLRAQVCCRSSIAIMSTDNASVPATASGSWEKWDVPRQRAHMVRAHPSESLLNTLQLIPCSAGSASCLGLLHCVFVDLVDCFYSYYWPATGRSATDRVRSLAADWDFLSKWRVHFGLDTGHGFNYLGCCECCNQPSHGRVVLNSISNPLCLDTYSCSPPLCA